MERSTFNRLFGGAPSRDIDAASRAAQVLGRAKVTAMVADRLRAAATPPALAKPNRIR